MNRFVLRANPSKSDDSWRFELPEDALKKTSKKTPKKPKADVLYGKFIKFSPKEITFEISQLPSNRILRDDDESKFILVSFAELRFPDSGPSVGRDYINRLMKAGLFLNKIQYRFYHHSSSQLRERSCYLRQATTDAELDVRIYRLGDFERIMNIAKRAKRIGLLFSAAEIDYHLDPQYAKDIPDIKLGDEIFSDGCIWDTKAYCHPEMDKDLVQFRYSMKKFKATRNYALSVVDFSKPYAFGRLNNDIIVLLSSLGITNEKLLQKQKDYFAWIAGATQNLPLAIDFLSSLGQHELVKKVLLDGLDDPAVYKQLRAQQMAEVNNFRKNDKPRTRMMIHKSRLIFGVCDPFSILREGEVFLRVTVGRKGATTAIHGDVLVVRNPCLHPGDCLKLRAVNNPRLSHLVDCLVFATVAKPGHQAAPAMSSGGDLDGDKFFVCWDADLVPARIAQSYDYPPNKEHISREVTRAHLANHFASYNSSGLAKVANLHRKWAQSKGALSSQCQELNALHSQSVDGANIKIPERLLTPPEATEPYILELLANDADEFATSFASSPGIRETLEVANVDDGRNLVLQLLRNKQSSFSEYQLFGMAFRLAKKHQLDFRPFLIHLDFGAFSASEKHALTLTMSKSSGNDTGAGEASQPNRFTPEDHPYMWNSLLKSDILTTDLFYQKDLNRPYPLQCLYSSRLHGLATFFTYLQMAQDFSRKVLLMKTDDRFTVGIFMRGDIPWDEDPNVAANIVVCPFLAQSSFELTPSKPCAEGYKLHCGEGTFQLYNGDKRDTFVFISRPPAIFDADVSTSIALQKISKRVQTQIGRVNKTPVAAIELHVVSNRDRLAHQLFDLWFEQVPTEAYIKRSARDIISYERNNLKNVDWEKRPVWLKDLFVPENSSEIFQEMLFDMTDEQRDTIMDFALEFHAENELFSTFRTFLASSPIQRDTVSKWIEREPQLVFALLKAYPPDDSCLLPDEISPLTRCVVRNIIRSANILGIATLVALEKIAASIAQLPVEIYLELLTLASLSIRAPQTAQEILLVLNESRASIIAESDASRYVHKFALAVAFDLAEEATDECPCDEDGKPKKQRTAPAIIKLDHVLAKPGHAKGHVRIDLRNSVRLHSHIRLQAASKPEKEWIEAPIMDGVVVQAMKGEILIELLHPPPPEMSRMDWKMYNAGVIANSQAMMDALLRLWTERASCCRFHNLITDRSGDSETTLSDVTQLEDDPSIEDMSHLNPSQLEAVRSCGAPLSLIWGPPGTGKTETVVCILRQLIRTMTDVKILVAASTHNAVDNVLKRLVELNEKEKLLGEDKMLRVATDHSKVDKSLQHFTIDARVGGDMNENNRLFKQAQGRVDAASIVFTTCAGAGLGILRKVDFDIVLIDEASQITEPCTLIPLVKGCQRAIIVGDHVQLRPMVREMGKVLEYDVSLLERLYKGALKPGMRRTMLNIQYRFPQELADFPSREFYEGKLQTGIQDSAEVLSPLSRSSFPWPKNNGIVVPTVFIQCSSEEDMGGRSKSNSGQAELICRIVPMLQGSEPESSSKINITVLTPYTKQLKILRNTLPSSVACFTIDSFQGRESDIIIFSTVRCNNEGDIGFVEDARRLNVMWTRAKLALIIIGDRGTMQTNALWKRAITSCVEVNLPPVSD